MIQESNGDMKGLASYQRIKVHFDKVVGVLITICDAKNDQEGVGHRYHYTKEPVTETRVFDITTDLWNFAIVTKPVKDKPFFYVPAKIPWALNQSTYSIRIKEVATLFNLDHKRVRTQSIRAGTATTLGAGRATNYEIKSLGGWKSDVNMEYIRATTQNYAHAHALLANPSTLRLDDYLMASASYTLPLMNSSKK